VQTVFSGLSPLVIGDVVDEGERVVVRARTPQNTAVCPVCGVLSGRVHGYHWRTVADVPVDGRRVVVRVRVRRLVCPTRGCRHTFREQVPGVLERYQRRTARLASQVKAVVQELAGRAGARLLAILAVVLSRHTALRTLLRIPLPTGRVPRVIGVDDFALRRFSGGCSGHGLSFLSRATLRGHGVPVNRSGRGRAGPRPLLEHPGELGEEIVGCRVVEAEGRLDLQDVELDSGGLDDDTEFEHAFADLGRGGGLGLGAHQPSRRPRCRHRPRPRRNPCPPVRT